MRLAFHLVVFNTLIDDFNWWQSDDYDEIAQNILAGHGYVAKEGLSPDTSRTPLYVVFLVLQFALFGKSIFALIVTQSLLQAFACIVLYRLANEVVEDRNLALIAVLGIAFFPQSMLYATCYHPESLFLLTSVLTGLYFYRFWREPDYRWALLTGGMAGLLTLTKPIAQLLIVGLLLGVILRYRDRIRFSLPRAAAMAASFLVIVTPWVIRNYQVEGGFVSVASRGGRFFHQITVEENSGDIDLYKEIEILKQDSVIENKETAWLNSAVGNILEDPGLFVRNILKNMVAFWYRGHYLTVSIVNAIINFTLLFFAVIGFARARRRRIPIAPFLILICYYNLVHAFTFGMARYAFPIIPFVLIFTVYGLFVRSSSFSGCATSTTRASSWQPSDGHDASIKVTGRH